jgi:CheY-like chemotaxis protein
MPEPSPVKTRVLFVDDDSGFLDMVNRIFGELSGGSWDIFLCHDAPSASRLLKKQSVDLAVLDVCMPGMDGLQLLSTLNRDCPSLPKVLLTGGASSETRTAGLEGGAELFLEKPTSPPGFQTVFATLNELVKWHQKQGLRGALRRAGLLDMVKIECVSGNSRLFEIQAGDTRGLIYVKEGSIVHAETEGRRGQSAFTFLATLTDAEFNLKQFAEPPERSIYRQWEFLFLEAFQLQEQLSQVEARGKEPKESKPTAAPKPRPSAPAAPATPPLESPEAAPDSAAAKAVAPLATGGTSLYARTAATAPAPAPAPATAPTPPLAPKAALPELGQLKMVRTAPTSGKPRPAPAPLELPARKLAPARLWPDDDWQPGESKIQETLICSRKQEVLHDWQCQKADDRLQFVHRVWERSTQLAEALPLGPCDRLELRDAAARTQILFQGEAALLVRSNTPAWPAAKVASATSQPTLEWLAQFAGTRGLLASSILHPSGQIVTPPVSTESAWQNLTALWRGTGEVFDWSGQQQLVAHQLRWVFERAQLYCIKRSDDLALALLLTKNPQILDAAVLEQMFAGFVALDAA